MGENERNAIGQLWQNAREKKGWSQERASKESGVSAKTISRLERSATKVQAYNKLKLAEAYGSSVAEIEGGLTQSQYEDIHKYISAVVRIQDYKRYEDTFLLLGFILLIMGLFMLALACISYKEGNATGFVENALFTLICFLAFIMCFIASCSSGHKARKAEKENKEPR